MVRPQGAQPFIPGLGLGSGLRVRVRDVVWYHEGDARLALKHLQDGGGELNRLVDLRQLVLE